MSRYVDGLQLMGGLGYAPVSDVALRLRDAYGLMTCVETGTFFGTSAIWASRHFREVVTIEIDPDLCRTAGNRCQGLANVTIGFGDSRVLLPQAIGKLRGPALFWIDAHPVCRRSDGRVVADHGLPTWDELSAVGESPLRHCVLIDDAHLLDAPGIMTKGRELGYRVRKVDDVIVWSP